MYRFWRSHLLAELFGRSVLSEREALTQWKKAGEWMVSDGWEIMSYAADQ
jgi:hypothetical protein